MEIKLTCSTCSTLQLNINRIWNINIHWIKNVMYSLKMLITNPWGHLKFILQNFEFILTLWSFSWNAYILCGSVLVSSHHLHQSWLILYCTSGNKIQWYVNQDTMYFKMSSTAQQHFHVYIQFHNFYQDNKHLKMSSTRQQHFLV